MSETDSEIDASRAPLLEHLVELRSRLLKAFGAYAIAFAICYYFSKPIFAVLVQPLLAAGQKKLIYTQIFEAFFVDIKVAAFAAIMLAFPVIANQIWQFVAPGLYRKEKRALLPFLMATPLLFAAGACLAYFMAIPLALHFLLGPNFQGMVGGVQQEALPGVGNYLGFVMQFLFGFGIAFLLPVLLLLLEQAGLITRKQLISARRYAIVGSFGIAMVLTPPDIGSMLLLAVPLCILYELTIVAAWFTERARRNRPVEAVAE
ncbi:MAG: twin-arginine translocase subunit TatC [Pseudomonadota bacterium]